MRLGDRPTRKSEKDKFQKTVKPLRINSAHWEGYFISHRKQLRHFVIRNMSDNCKNNSKNERKNN